MGVHASVSTHARARVHMPHAAQARARVHACGNFMSSEGAWQIMVAMRAFFDPKKKPTLTFTLGKGDLPIHYDAVVGTDHDDTITRLDLRLVTCPTLLKGGVWGGLKENTRARV